MKPLVVIVSGVPGSGKAALASKLAEYMRLPLVERDAILRGIEYTRGPFDKAKVGIPLFYALLKNMIEAGISLVANDTLYKNVSEKDLKANILPYSTTVNVHTLSTSGEPEYFKTTQQKKLYQRTIEPLDLTIPTLEVIVSDDLPSQISETARRIREFYTGEPQDLWNTIGGDTQV